jgi:hypothetical protein
MEGLKDKTADLLEHAEDIAETYYKLTLLNVTQKATNIGSSFLVIVAVSIFGVFAMLFCGIALSIWIGDLIESRAAGFLIGAAVYLIILGIIMALRKKVVFKYFRDLIIRKIYDKTD